MSLCRHCLMGVRRQIRSRKGPAGSGNERWRSSTVRRREHGTEHAPDDADAYTDPYADPHTDRWPARACPELDTG